MLSIKKENLRINPVLLKELKVKMRSWKAAILIGVYNLVLTLLTIFITKISMDEHTMIVDTSVILGIYTFMSVMQFGMITLISPALTAGAIAGEREKQTLDILLSTTMKHRSIIVGKLLASLSHIILLVVSSLPTFSIIFLYGAIGVKELLQMFLFYIVTALTFGSIGIFFSTFFKKSTAANVLSYAVIVFLFIGTILISIFYIYLVIMPKTNYNYNGTFFLFYLN
ncbi:MAG TPA: ABC transporter, partial [Erysipelotrichaceae bacterium]|nr:ABC transporter [Erysipelotrichaceae bacterium]